jgi:WD40 repeat protein
VGKNPKKFHANIAHRSRLLLTPDAESIVYGNPEKEIVLMNIQTGMPIRVLKGHEFPVTGMAITADGSTLVSSSMDGTIRTWDIANLK